MGPDFRPFVNPLVVPFCRLLSFATVWVVASLVCGGARADEAVDAVSESRRRDSEAATGPALKEKKGESEPPEEKSAGNLASGSGRTRASETNPPPLLPPVQWSPVYRRFTAVEAVATGVFTAGIIATRIVGPRRGGPEGGVWIDENVRGVLRAENYEGRLLAKDMSDVLLNLSVSYALLVDPLINAAWLRKSPDVGIEVGLINAEVLALTLGVQELTASLVGRERPYGRTCNTDELGEDTHSCQGRNRYRSYFSGHTSVPFSLAAATCVHHTFIPLSGRNSWLTCSLGFLVAASSGILRIVSDNHYATDVLTGAAFGTLVGLTLPLLHYVRDNRWAAPPVALWDLELVPTYGGAVLQGRFL